MVLSPSILYGHMVFHGPMKCCMAIQYFMIHETLYGHEIPYGHTVFHDP